MHGRQRRAEVGSVCHCLNVSFLCPEFLWNVEEDFRPVPDTWIPAKDIEFSNGSPLPDENGHMPGTRGEVGARGRHCCPQLGLAQELAAAASPCRKHWACASLLACAEALLSCPAVWLAAGWQPCSWRQGGVGFLSAIAHSSLAGCGCRAAVAVQCQQACASCSAWLTAVSCPRLGARGEAQQAALLALCCCQRRGWSGSAAEAPHGARPAGDQPCAPGRAAGADPGADWHQHQC